MSTLAKTTEFYNVNPAALQADQAAVQALLARSSTDAEFRQKLLADPRAAVAEFTGRELPESFDVRFIENTADATFVLPAAIDGESELSESDLEAVAGGVTIIFVVTYTAGLGAYMLAHEMADNG